VTERKRSQKLKKPLPEGRTGWLQNFFKGSKEPLPPAHLDKRASFRVIFEN
jgi:hypothetical protein